MNLRKMILTTLIGASTTLGLNAQTDTLRVINKPQEKRYLLDTDQNGQLNLEKVFIYKNDSLGHEGCFIYENLNNLIGTDKFGTNLVQLGTLGTNYTNGETTQVASNLKFYEMIPYQNKLDTTRVDSFPGLIKREHIVTSTFPHDDFSQLPEAKQIEKGDTIKHSKITNYIYDKKDPSYATPILTETFWKNGKMIKTKVDTLPKKATKFKPRY